MQRCPKCSRSLVLDEFPKSSRGKRGAWCRACHRVKACGPDVSRGCDGCGATLRVTERRAAEPRVYCSRGCKDSAKRAALRAIRLALKSNLTRHCSHCAAAIRPVKRADAHFCSAECESAAHNATRKASWKVGERQEYVSRAEIIARDGLRCHICGGDVEPDDVHLDHVIPLARGGTHEASNLAVAHSLCNLRKGAKLS